MAGAKKKYNNYLDNGVSLSPVRGTLGSQIKLSYDGLLVKSGASDVYAHIGYGGNWQNLQDIKMAKTSSGFEATIPVNQKMSLNICFKDATNNWDNNSGQNYVFNMNE